MFTGIVEEIGRVVSVRREGAGCKIKIAVEPLTVNDKTSENSALSGLRIGDSIAVNGVCLTVTEFDDYSFCAEVMPETLRSSTLGALKFNDAVNLERALLVAGMLDDQIDELTNVHASGRLNGHIVTGHIDGTGVIASMREEGNAVIVSVRAAAEILKYIVMKGSVALDGISLTVSKLEENTFSVSLIPETRRRTVFGLKRAGDSINIECDILGKYVEKFLCGSAGNRSKKRGEIDMDFLSRNGF